MSHAIQLSDVCKIVMGQAPSGESYNTDGQGLPLIAGAGDFGELYPAAKKFTTEASKVCAAGDIVLGIRATIGEKVLADGRYCLGRGVAALRPGNRLDGRYLWHWLGHINPLLVSKARGATFLQVNKTDIGELPIDLPPLTEQRRSAAILDKANSLRSTRREALANLDRLAQSLFVEMFGDPIDNNHRYPIKKLVEIVDPARPISYGILMPGPDVSDGVRYVRVVDMKNGGIDVSSVRRTTTEISQSYKRSLLRPGDLLMSIRGHVGRLALVPDALDGANITQDSARLAISGASSLYVRECLRTPGFQRWMAKHTKGVAVRGINLGDVKLMPIPLPPQERQDEFAQRVQSIERAQKRCRDALVESDALFATLQHRAFQGAL